MFIAEHNKLRRYEIIINNGRLIHEKEFYATDCGGLGALVMRNIRPIRLIRQRAEVPGRHLQHFAVFPVKSREGGRSGCDQCPCAEDQGIGDISVRRQEGHNNAL